MNVKRDLCWCTAPPADPRRTSAPDVVANKPWIQLQSVSSCLVDSKSDLVQSNEAELGSRQQQSTWSTWHQDSADERAPRRGLLPGRRLDQLLHGPEPTPESGPRVRTDVSLPVESPGQNFPDPAGQCVTSCGVRPTCTDQVSSLPPQAFTVERPVPCECLEAGNLMGRQIKL